MEPTHNESEMSDTGEGQVKYFQNTGLAIGGIVAIVFSVLMVSPLFASPESPALLLILPAFVVFPLLGYFVGSIWKYRLGRIAFWSLTTLVVACVAILIVADDFI